MDNLNLQDLAKMFDSLAKNTYQIIANSYHNDEIHINIRFSASEFTHIFGLDHLDSIKRYVKNKIVLKKALYDNILKGKFNIDNLTNNDIDNLEMPVSKSVNPITGQQYTLKDRLIALSDIMKYLKSPENTLIYKNWSGKDTKINADYAIVIQSERDKNERLFLFGYADKAMNKDKSVNVNIYSAFFDIYSFARGKSKPFRVEKELIIDNNTKEIVFSYERAQYDVNPKSNVIKFEIPEITPPLAVAGSAAVAAQRKTVEITVPKFPDPFGKLKKVLKNFADKIKSAFFPKPPPKQHKPAKKSPSAQERRSPPEKPSSPPQKAVAANTEVQKSKAFFDRSKLQAAAKEIRESARSKDTDRDLPDKNHDHSL